MKKSYLTVSLVMLFALLISCNEARAEEICYCAEQYGVPVKPEYIADWAFVTFNWVEGEPGMAAHASYVYDEETNSVICVVTARMPDNVLGDPEMDSIGHEILHCVTGDFHEGEH